MIAVFNKWLRTLDNNLILFSLLFFSINRYIDQSRKYVNNTVLTVAELKCYAEETAKAIIGKMRELKIPFQDDDDDIDDDDDDNDDDEEEEEDEKKGGKYKNQHSNNLKPQTQEETAASQDEEVIHMDSNDDDDNKDDLTQSQSILDNDF